MFKNINTNICFVQKRYIANGLCLLMLIVTFVMMMSRGLNYGIDFKGGIIMEIKTDKPNQISDIRALFSKLDVGAAAIQEFGSDYDLLIRLEAPSGGERAITDVVSKVKVALGEGVTYRKLETIGPKIGAELVWQGFYAIVLAILAIMFYVWLRYEWQFALSGTLTLIVDCIVILCFYSVFSSHEFSINSIVAILMTAGYSINDKVVVFDRISENLKDYGKSKDFDLAKIIDKSLNDVLTRTILTSLTTILALLPLYFFGGNIISTFSLPMIIGITFGTFSSIFVASPLLLTIGYKVKKDDR